LTRPAAYIVNGVAPDVVVSMIKAIEFVNSHAGSEITMVGHSKGGYEAIMNALVTDTNCITFNVLSPFNSGSSIAMYIELLSARYTKRMTHYVVAGEIAFVGNSVFGSNYGNPAWSTVVYLLGPHPAWNTFANHGMDSVAIALGGTPLELYPAKPVPYTAPPVPGVRPSITPPPPTPKPTPTPNYNPPSIPGQPVPGARPW